VSMQGGTSGYSLVTDARVTPNLDITDARRYYLRYIQ